jgi:uncharacterized protein
LSASVTDGQLARLERLRAALSSIDRLVVAFSGGADSAFLAKVATDALGTERVLCATAVSPSLAGEELADCAALADEWGLRWQTVDSAELDDPAYSANDTERCYHCKSALMEALEALEAQELLDDDGGRGGPEARAAAQIVVGVNVDDLAEHRPGQRAAAERGARFPLVEAEMTKDDVRALSRQLGLRTWDKPAAACLASRLPYGTPVTVSALSSVGAAEAALKALGYGQVRVRHYGELARIELEVGDLADALARRDQVVEAVHGAGYRYVTVDLEGFRSGNLNVAAGIVVGHGEANREGGRR